jgi:endonuclease/exonuclease/phosphatase family metal-dependent hydrolase
VSVSDEEALLRFVTWNIDLFSERPTEGVGVIAEMADVITLQEVRVERLDDVRSQLAHLGFASWPAPVAAAEKSYCCLIASRAPLTGNEDLVPGLPWPELLAHATVVTESGPLHVVTVHVPNGSNNGWKKIETLEALKTLVTSLHDQTLVLTGDFNEPQWAPLQDGHIVTWAQEEDEAGVWQVLDTMCERGVTDSGARWDSAVRWFFGKPRESGLRSAFWETHGYGAMEASHYSRRRERWFDHVFVSRDLRVESCEYLHDLRNKGFSDHSPLLVCLSLQPSVTNPSLLHT